MRLGGRISAAIEVLEEVETRHRPVSEALKDWGVAHRFAGSGDRAVIGNIVYDALRWRASSAWLAGDDGARGAVLAMLAHRWKLGLAGIEQALAADPHAPASLTAAERQRLEHTDLAGAPAHVAADVPEWTATHLGALFGGDWVAEGKALAERPPLDMRANRLLADRGKVVAALGKFGARPTPYAADGVRIAATTGEGRHPNVQVEPAFQQGWFEVQDEGSQIAALMVGVAPGEQILDLCAGAGGKTLALASAMGGKGGGRIVATDSDRMRLAPIFERIKRAEARAIEVREAGAALDDLAGRMDAVLVDAPCTGSGVWRRRPDAKWKLTERALGNRVAEQAALLPLAAQYVKPGGRLIYVTCSLLPPENDGQVAAFLAHAPDFGTLPAGETLASAGLSGALAAALLATPRGVILSPHRTETDGFFISVMRRQ
jgi:16S rRNA (cytosine967-C5)-methyltransferase